MYKKLLKYDLRSIWRFGLPILIALGAITVIGALNSLLFNLIIAPYIGVDFIPPGAEIWLTLGTTFNYIIGYLANVAMGIVPTAILVVVCVDFYQTLVTDQGYLTFTLPVQAKTIILSKFTNALIWVFGGGIACFLSQLLQSLVAVVSAGDTYGVGFTDLTTAMGEVFVDLMPLITPDVVLTIVLACILGVCYVINDILLYFAAIFFGSVISKKNKLLSAIGCIFGANFIYGLLFGIIFVIAIFTVGAAAVATEAIWLAINIALCICILVIAGISVGLYFALKYMMEKKLNLA